MIQTSDLRVDYDDVTAVRDLNLQIPAGQVYGLIGPNGAGKTSAIRVLATLQRPTYGDVAIAGIDIDADPAAVHRVLGYMPDLPPVEADLRCEEFLMLFAGAYFVDRRHRRRRVNECLELVDLTGKRRALAGTLSRGMTQRLVLAKTLLHEPRVLLLDEPASGLDPIARIDLRNILRDLGGLGCTVLISSHILTELADMCDAVGIMEKGVLRYSGRIDDIAREVRSQQRVRVELASPRDDLPAILGVSPREVELEGLIAHIDFDGDPVTQVGILRRLVEAGVPVLSCQKEVIGLEEIIIEVGAREVS